MVGRINAAATTEGLKSVETTFLKSIRKEDYKNLKCIIFMMTIVQFMCRLTFIVGSQKCEYRLQLYVTVPGKRDQLGNFFKI